MKMVKNLSKVNVKNYEGFVRREDLDFSDDGNYFRGFEYKGMPITTLRSDGITYLSVRVDYLHNEFTYGEWASTNEYLLTNEFNGVCEFDMDKLVENLEKIIVKVAEMNKAAKTETLDMSKVELILSTEIEYAKEVVENFKKNFKWYEAPEHVTSRLIGYLKAQEREIENASITLASINELERQMKKSYIERLEKYGYVIIRKYGFYLEEMVKAIND